MRHYATRRFYAGLIGLEGSYVVSIREQTGSGCRSANHRRPRFRGSFHNCGTSSWGSCVAPNIGYVTVPVVTASSVSGVAVWSEEVEKAVYTGAVYMPSVAGVLRSLECGYVVRVQRARNTPRTPQLSASRGTYPHPTGSERCSKKAVTDVRLPRLSEFPDTPTSILRCYKGRLQ
jgi:hypothetical protein